MISWIRQIIVFQALEANILGGHARRITTLCVIEGAPEAFLCYTTCLPLTQVTAASTQGYPGSIDGKRVDGETSGNRRYTRHSRPLSLSGITGRTRECDWRMWCCMGGDTSPSAPAHLFGFDRNHMGIELELELTPAPPVSMAGHFLPSDSDSDSDFVSDGEMEMETKINNIGVKHELRTTLALPVSSGGHFLPSDSDSDSDSDSEWESDSESAAGTNDDSKGPQTMLGERLLAGVKRMLQPKVRESHRRGV